MRNGFDVADQLVNIADTKGTTTFLGFTYLRDKAGLLTSSVPVGVTQPAETYTYDALNRISTVNSTTTYGFTAADGLSKIKTATTQTYGVGDQLSKTTTGAMVTTYVFDARGNRTSQTTGTATTTASYDEENRLTARDTNTYAYDGDGLRQSKNAAGVTSQETWDLADGLPMMLNDGTNRYVYGPDGAPIEQVAATNKVT